MSTDFNEVLRVLLIEDSASDARVIQSILRSRCDVVWVETMVDALPALAAGQFSAILADLDLPDSRGLATVNTLVRNAPRIPIIVFTGHDDDVLAMRAMAEGAEDYLVKGNVDALGLLRSLRYAIQRKHAERAIRDSEARLRAVIASALDAVVGMDVHGRITTWNPRATAIFGYQEHEAIGQPLGDLIIPERMRERHRSGFAQFLATGITPIMDKRITATGLRRDGTEFPIELSVTAIADDTGLLFNAFVADISERSRAEEVRIAAERRFRVLVENNADGIALLDPDGDVLYSTPAITGMLGYTVEEFLGVNIFSLIHPSDIAEARVRFQACLAGEPPEIAPELRFRHRDGTWRFINVVRANQLDDPTVNAIVVNYRDMTELRASREALDALQGQSEVILNSIVSGVHGMDLNGRITLENPASARMLGWSASELTGRSAHETIHHTRIDGTPHDRSVCPIHATLADGLVRHIEDDIFWRRDGTSFPVSYTAAPMFDRDGKIVGAVVTFSDVTKQKEMEALIEQGRRVTSLGRVAASVAHEFNNVMMGIQPFGEVLLRKLEGDERGQTAARRILEAVNRGRHITGQILRFTNPAEPQTVTLDIGQWLADFQEEANAVVANRRLCVESCDSLQVRADETQLHQIMVNLLANARDATTVQDSVTIGATPASSVEFVAERVPDAERFAALFVRDTGKGISPEILSHIFEPLFTTKRSGGTGLGLAVARQIVTHHGGSILVDSAPGAGSTFYIVLPTANSIAA
jgi:PAS domain S-box-containing protein